MSHDNALLPTLCPSSSWVGTLVTFADSRQLLQCKTCSLPDSDTGRPPPSDTPVTFRSPSSSWLVKVKGAPVPRCWASPMPYLCTLTATAPAAVWLGRVHVMAAVAPEVMTQSCQAEVRGQGAGHLCRCPQKLCLACPWI